MTIEKLTEFAKTGQKNTDDLDLETGFIVNRKPARQWFNWLFSTLTTKINEIIDADFMPKSDVIDNLTTDDATKPVSAKQARLLQDNKLGKNENAATATKLQTARTIGGVSFDGSANINLPGVNTAGNQNTTGNAATATTAAACSGNAASATDCSRSVIAGNGLSGGGALTSNRTVTLGTPGNITATSTNSVTETSHTHNLDINSLPLLGVGQTWQNVSRSLGSTYTNNTGRPIQISIFASGSSGSALALIIDGLELLRTNQSATIHVTAVIPNGSSYTMTAAGLGSWKELR